MATDEKKLGAVYVGWSTFRNAINTLTQAMPNRIDKSVFAGLAGGVQSQLIAGLKFLGLVGEDSKATPALLALAVRDEADRKKQLAKILRSSYSKLFELDLAKTTPAELRERMGESYGVSGGTLDRAVRFFISAAEFAEITLSALVSKAKSNGAPVARRRRSTPRQRSETAQVPAPSSAVGASKTITLASGDTLTLSTSAGLFSLSRKDREYVLGLIDKLEEYEKASKSEIAKEEP